MINYYLSECGDDNNMFVEVTRLTACQGLPQTELMYCVLQFCDQANKKVSSYGSWAEVLLKLEVTTHSLVRLFIKKSVEW